MSGFGDTTPRFEWRHRQDDGWGWSVAHTIDGPCSGCCPTNALRDCPRCAGRLHREPAIIDDQLDEALFCQQERTDGKGRATRMRSAPSEAETAAKIAAMRRRDRERVDRWIGRVVGGVLAVKVALAALFVVAVVLGFLGNL
ncbi:hypothetical protein ACFRIB_38270 [Streptomyces mirabilis]|uniref:hypothetical protein n=1 Tax=Streptomyces mirabilis TaxID=68239 RepID=UPI0036C79EEC